MKYYIKIKTTDAEVKFAVVHSKTRIGDDLDILFATVTDVFDSFEAAFMGLGFTQEQFDAKIKEMTDFRID